MTHAKAVDSNQALSPRAPTRTGASELAREDVDLILKEFILDYTLASLPFEH